MISMLESGRTRQKRRTHDALVKVALELLRAGESPTVSDVARAAQVSPATAVPERFTVELATETEPPGTMAVEAVNSAPLLLAMIIVAPVVVATYV